MIRSVIFTVIAIRCLITGLLDTPAAAGVKVVQFDTAEQLQKAASLLEDDNQS